jgi:hypothetical protein
MDHPDHHRTRAEPLDTIGGDDDRGDGAVPLTGALGHDLPIDTHAIHRVVEQHGHLQAHRGVLDAVAEILGAKPERRRGLGDIALPNAADTRRAARNRADVHPAGRRR